MTVASEVIVAANTILSGDDSVRSAAALEAALHAHHLYEQDFEGLVEVLALYSPGAGAPYTDRLQLCDAIRHSPIGSQIGRA